MNTLFYLANNFQTLFQRGRVAFNQFRMVKSITKQYLGLRRPILGDSAPCHENFGDS